MFIVVPEGTVIVITVPVEPVCGSATTTLILVKVAPPLVLI